MLKPYIVIVDREEIYCFIHSCYDTFDEASEAAKGVLQYHASAVVRIAEIKETKVPPDVDCSKTRCLDCWNRPAERLEDAK